MGKKEIILSGEIKFINSQDIQINDDRFYILDLPRYLDRKRNSEVVKQSGETIQLLTDCKE
jgi:hypothetical protein